MFEFYFQFMKTHDKANDDQAILAINEFHVIVVPLATKPRFHVIIIWFLL